jgi:hypothetical protein
MYEIAGNLLKYSNFTIYLVGGKLGRWGRTYVYTCSIELIRWQIKPADRPPGRQEKACKPGPHLKAAAKGGPAWPLRNTGVERLEWSHPCSRCASDHESNRYGSTSAFTSPAIHRISI